MARKAKRDLTMEEQLARGPMDLPFLMLTLLLLGIGLIMVFSASFASAYYDSSNAVQNNPMHYIQRQAVFAAAGVVIMYLISKINYQTLRILAMPLLAISVVLLVLVLTPLGVRLNGAQRWLYLFFVAGPTYQPSEIAKVTVIIYFSARLSKRGSEKKRKYTNRTLTGRTLRRLDRIGFLELVPYGVVLLIVLGLVVLEPHMSGTILIMMGAAAVLFAAGIHWGWFIAAGSLAGSALAFIIFNTEYMTDRINIWLDPWLDPRGDGFQPIQSLIAIGSGGLLGRGLGNSNRSFCICPKRKTTMCSPSWWRNWASWAVCWCCSCLLR